ncbi:MBL fold metallo-hydrolase [Sneathiella sp. HT1-7]|jgi:glyoxylase-like metal-dependent hydrolase (beta-lactamase superfamily II)|uniref:MBL fold metallo-hydrolase n=1 Tax=Sneathiella sp. HT1-7 TaxID=2887192 RepID=UPI001D14A1D4|nr:MBL fold metallo-hydrolase [Sneathiella sp. HT1-7]MCC3304393.1 MBL fold metallo-hydrolase [Sneathiella sp. HT1-7]
MSDWQIGNVKITRVVEVEATGGTRFILPQATPDAVQPIDWLVPHFATAEGKLIMSIHALIIDTGSRRIIVDTCLGNDKKREIPAWNMLQTTFLADLEAAGYPRESFDTVLCTHLHVDHVGWNTMLVDGEWMPTFPNARYLIGATEWDYWRATAQDEFGDVIGDSVTPIIDAGLADLVAMDHQICDEVSLFPSPGHTPGHVCVQIRSAGEEAIITGDSMHHPCQIAHPEWSSAVDADAAAAQSTRHAFLEKYGNTDTLIIGTHFATPTAGRLKKKNTGEYWLKV